MLDRIKRAILGQPAPAPRSTMPVAAPETPVTWTADDARKWLGYYVHYVNEGNSPDIAELFANAACSADGITA